MANKRVIPLNDTLIKSSKAKEKDYTLADGNGLQLLVKMSGSKVWEVRYTVNGKTTKTTIGNYPSVSLAEARKKRDAYKEKAKEGISLTKERKEAKQAHIDAIDGLLHTVMTNYLAKIKDSVTKSTYDHTKRRFERDILPHFSTFKPSSLCTFEDVITSKSMKDIKHPELLKAVLVVEERGAIDTAHRLLTECNNLWLYALQHGHVENNIIANIDKKHALKKIQKKHFASTTDPSELKRFMEFAKGFTRSYIARYALQILPYLFLRASNIRLLEWTEIDFEKKLLTIKAEKMKKPENGDFIFPLHQTVIDILNEVKQFTKDSKYVFPSPQDRKNPISNNTLSKALRENGFKNIITPHGFRATFSSIAYGNTHIHGLSEKAIEACLHHAERNEVAGSYNYKANYLPQMTILMEWWSDYLDGLKHG
ncbi:MAG: integrase arm-type DNA-binding domain-containing protein [Sulfurospirillaceae bacterium]|nr:integrase arm-type DNA-binding domain-containing protein [Sulfurospirillaceae bacterium]